MTIKTNVKAGGGQPPLPAQKERIKMKRIVNGLSQLNRGRRAYAVFALCAATAMALPAQKTFTTLQSFDSTDGANPGAALVQATDGDFYGTASSQGANGGGTIFKVTLSGTLVTLYNFCSESGCTDGVLPEAALVQATSGDFYGTTNDGGLSYGTVFRITPGGTLTTLYRFCSQSGCRDGSNPFAGLVQTANGDFYGTARNGGANAVGTVFEITPSGALTTLYSFCSESGCADGANPVAGLVQATNGNLYGTTLAGGGATNGGTVFEITPSGRLTTLYTFCSQSGCTDGSNPLAGLVEATNGDLYGTTNGGGASDLGTVFKITPSGTLTTLHSFDRTDGSAPGTVLVQGTDGNFYGTTYGGGAHGDGTIFEMAPSGTLATLHSFCPHGACTGGRNPEAGLLQATNGTFYGTTYFGGANRYGTVFSLSVGLGSFVKTQPARGEVGAAINILGTDLTGATSVSFNGTEATFTVVSGSEITTTVPVGATTGTVQVVTPSSTLSSNVPFRVP